MCWIYLVCSTSPMLSIVNLRNMPARCCRSTLHSVYLHPHSHQFTNTHISLVYFFTNEYFEFIQVELKNVSSFQINHYWAQTKWRGWEWLIPPISHPTTPFPSSSPPLLSQDLQPSTPLSNTLISGAVPPNISVLVNSFIYIAMGSWKMLNNHMRILSRI